MRAQIPLFSVVAALALATAAQSRPQAAAPPPPPDRGGAAAVLAGEKDLRMQVLLDRAHFSVGEIDGNAGSNTSRAFQPAAIFLTIMPYSSGLGGGGWPGS